MLSVTVVAMAAACALPGATSNGAGGGSTLIMGFPADVHGREVDPALTVGGAATPFLYSVYDTLYKFDADGVPRPNIVTDDAVSPDGRIVTLRLQKGITFQDGSPLSARDVKFSLDRARGKDPTLKGPTSASSLSRISDVRVTDDSTVVIELTEPNPILKNVLAYFPGMVVPADYFRKVGNDGFLKAPMGSGPYKLVAATQGQSLRLDAFDHYVGNPKPAYNTIVMKILPDSSARLAALRSGGIDFAVDVDVTQIASLEAAGFTVQGNRAGQRLMVTLNSQTPGLSDPRVGRALNMAVNREAIRDGLFHGKSTLAPTADPQISLDKISPYPYDPEAAKRLLDEAGFDRNRALTLDYPAGNFPLGELIVQAVQSDLAAVGVKLDLNPMDPNTWSTKMQAKSLDDLNLNRFKNLTYDSYQSLNDAFSCAGSYSTWCNPAMDERLKALAPIAGAARRTDFLELDKSLSDSPPAIFLIDPDQIYAMRAGIEWQPTSGTTIYTFAQIHPTNAQEG